MVVLNGILKILLKPLKWQSQNQERCLKLKSLYVGLQLKTVSVELVELLLGICTVLPQLSTGNRNLKMLVSSLFVIN